MTFEDDQTTTESTNVSRRTVVRGAAAVAWTIPAVSLVTAAPAYAASADIALVTTANYLSHTQANLANPTILLIQAVITNNGPQPASGVAVQLRIPGAQYAVAPRVSTPATITGGNSISGGGVNTDWTGGGSNPWLLSLTVGGNIPSGASRTITLQVQFRDGGDPVGGLANFNFLDHSPFRRWAGNQFTLSSTATATNHIAPASSDATVAATPASTFTWKYARVALIGGQSIARTAIDELYNSGRSSIGQITLVVEIQRANHSNSRWYSAPDAEPKNVHSDWTYVAGSFNNGANNVWRWSFRTKELAFAPPASNGGPSGTGVDGPPTRYVAGPIGSGDVEFRAHLQSNGGSHHAIGLTAFSAQPEAYFEFSAPHATSPRTANAQTVSDTNLVGVDGTA